MRRVAVGLLVLLYGVAGLASVVGVWSARTVLDTDRFTRLVVSVADSPEVSDALASALVDQIVMVARDRRVLADRVPDELEPYLPLVVSGIRPAVEEQVSEMLRSDRALDALDVAISRSHRAVIQVLRSDDPLQIGPLRTEGDTVVIDLSALIALSLDALVERGVLPADAALGLDPESATAGQVRAALERRFDLDLPTTFGTVVVFDSDAVGRAGIYVTSGRRALAVFERAVVALVITTVVFAAGALALSESRRRTGIQLALATVAVGVTTVLVSRRALRAVPALVEDPEARRAAASIVANVASGLVRLSEALIVLGALVLIAGWLAGPSGVGRALRSRVVDVGGLRSALAAYPDAVRIVGVTTIAAILLWWDWSTLTVVISLAIAVAVAVGPVAAAATIEADQPAQTR